MVYIHGHLAICQIIFKYGKKHIVAVSIYVKWKGEKKKKRLSSSHNLSVRLDIYREWVIKSSFSPCSVQRVLNLFLKRKQGQFCYLLWHIQIFLNIFYLKVPTFLRYFCISYEFITLVKKLLFYNIMHHYNIFKAVVFLMFEQSP